jgi:hypothetical protein
MTEPRMERPDSDQPQGPSRRPTIAADSGPIVLDRQLEGRLAAIADGRVLVIEYLITRPSWSLAAAELSVRVQRSRPRGSMRLATLEGVECFVEPRLAPVLREAGLTLRPVAGAVLGQFEVDVIRPLAWIDFLSSTAARRP